METPDKSSHFPAKFSLTPSILKAKKGDEDPSLGFKVSFSPISTPSHKVSWGSPTQTGFSPSKMLFSPSPTPNKRALFSSQGQDSFSTISSLASFPSLIEKDSLKASLSGSLNSPDKVPKLPSFVYSEPTEGAENEPHTKTGNASDKIKPEEIKAMYQAASSFLKNKSDN